MLSDDFMHGVLGDERDEGGDLTMCHFCKAEGLSLQERKLADGKYYKLCELCLGTIRESLILDSMERTNLLEKWMLEASTLHTNMILHYLDNRIKEEEK